MDGQGRYEGVVAEVVEQMRAEFGGDLEGMLLGGSVALGRAAARSDLDLYVIIRPAWRQRRNYYLEGVEVELFINPAAQIRRELADPERSSTAAMFAQGRILHDPRGVIALLKAEAQAVRAQGRPAAEGVALHRLRYRPTDLLKDAQDLLEGAAGGAPDEAAVQLHIALALKEGLDAHYKLARRWPVKPKYLLADLQEHAPELARLARAVLESAAPVADRCARLAELIERILCPAGGLFREGETEPEQLGGDT